MAPSRPSLLRAALAAALLVASLPLHASADAELLSTVPADGDDLFESPVAISATFDEALGTSSTIELRTAAGATLASGGVDPADPATLSLTPPSLGDGSYEVRWTAVADDGHVTRGTFGFNVALPPTAVPTQTSGPSATPAPTATPAPSPSPTAAPSAAPTQPAAGAEDVLIPILAAVVLLAALGAWLLSRRSRSA